MAYLVNEDFVETAKVIAKSKGMSTLPHLVLPRTINTTPPEEVEALAEKAVEEIVNLLGVKK